MTQLQPIIDCTNGDDRWIDLSDRGNADGKAAEDPKFTPNWHELFLRGQKETRGFLFWGLESPVYSILWLHYPGVRFFFFSSLLNLSPTDCLSTVYFKFLPFFFFLSLSSYPFILSFLEPLTHAHHGEDIQQGRRRVA